tara:strand:- start:706 stop:1218 length:513 start_codon:yes stop_codon:yes gene_type:complete
MDTIAAPITNLLKALAEAISPYLPGHGTADETTVFGQRVTALEDRMEDAVERLDGLPDVDEQIDEYISYNFDPTDHDLLTNSNFDHSDWGLLDSDEVTYRIEQAVGDAIGELDIEERVTSCVEEVIESAVEEAVKAALDAAGVVTYSTLLMVVKGADHEPSTFVAEGSEV